MHHQHTWIVFFKLQKRAARIILDAPYDAPTMPLFNQLGWLTLYELISLHKYVLLYRTFHGLSPQYLVDLFSFQSSNFYSLRSVSNGNLCIPSHKTNLFKNSFQYSGVHLWNSLPLNIRMSPSVSSFKYHIKNFIISKRRN